MLRFRHFLPLFGLCVGALGACGKSEREPDGGAGGGSGTSGSGGAGSDAGGRGGGESAGGQSGGSSSNLGEAGDAGTAGANGAGAAGAGGAPPGNQDAQTLLACDVPEPCGQTSAQLVEAYDHSIGASNVCLMNALAERTPGRYRHRNDSTFGNGSVGAEHTLILHDDGSVLYARVPYFYVFGPSLEDPPPPPPDPGSRCALKPASYFRGCLAAVQFATGGEGDGSGVDGVAGAGGSAETDEENAWRCVFGTGEVATPSTLEWFEQCAEESPVACADG
jgi:hypothetical protein